MLDHSTSHKVHRPLQTLAGNLQRRISVRSSTPSARIQGLGFISAASMDPAAKKRKSDENGAATFLPLSPEDAAKILDPFTHDQLLDIVKSALSRPDFAVLDAVRSIADRDPTQRKLFIRGLGWETTADSLRTIFSPFGDLEEAVIITDKTTGRSKGYGFITFRHIDGAIRALKDPSKQIDGRMTVTNLAAAGNSGVGGGGGLVRPTATAPVVDSSLRKIFVGNVPADMSSDRLLSHFASYGEIEEGPLGADKQTGKFRGYALFVYKTVEAAHAAIVDPNKSIDGHNLLCKLANSDSKKGKPGAQVAVAAVSPGSSLPGQFGVPGTFSSYTGSGLPGASGLSSHLNTALPSYGVGAGTPGLSTAVPSALGGLGAGSYGGGYGGAYGTTSQYGGQGGGGYGGLGVGSSLYRTQPRLGGVPSAGNQEGAQYPLSSLAYQSQHHHAAGSPDRRYPTARTHYPSLPPYY